MGLVNFPMRILLIGDYSNVHATLAEGLRALGHVVTVASDGDGWKDYPRDVDLRRYDQRAANAQTSGNLPIRGNFSRLTYYLRLCRTFRHFRGYDVVQLINPIFLPLRAERIWPFYRYLRRYNRRVFLGAFGMDYYYVKACLDCTTFRYSDFNFGTELRHYPDADAFRRDWYYGPKGTLNRRIAADCDGIVAGLYEYWAAYNNDAALQSKLRFIPFPIKLPATKDSPPSLSSPPQFFIGIQRQRSLYKGTDIMFRALERVARKLPNRLRIVKVENLPFAEYKQKLSQADVLLDQLYSYTPAMNALEAMAGGLVIVGGGEPENYEIVGETQLRPIVNVLPTEDDVYEKLRHLALHPEEILRLKAESLAYVRKHHDHINVARQYLAAWKGE